MLESVIHSERLAKYQVTLPPSEKLFLEGDLSRDLYVLVSGTLEVLKGSKRIARIQEPGAFVGEMSFLLDTERTSTIKTLTDVTALCIPQQEVKQFLLDFPEVSQTMTMLLARRLADTSRVAHGLQEFADQLPDAVVTTDKGGAVVSWNAAAEQVYGREREQMQGRPAAELFIDRDEYGELFAAARAGQPVRERKLMIEHPELGERSLSVSTTVLHDGHHNFQGMLFLGRDITHALELEQRYLRIRRMVVPVLAVCALLAAGIFFAVPMLFRPAAPQVGERQQALRRQLGGDYLVLATLLAEPIAAGDAEAAKNTMRKFCRMQDSAAIPYAGLLVLDQDKKVFAGCPVKDGVPDAAARGSSYGGVTFQGDGGSIHRVLEVYRRDKQHPMGIQAVELAFPLAAPEGESPRWLVFQMDMQQMHDYYEIDADGFARLRFEKSQQ